MLAVGLVVGASDAVGVREFWLWLRETERDTERDNEGSALPVNVGVGGSAEGVGEGFVNESERIGDAVGVCNTETDKLDVADGVVVGDSDFVAVLSAENEFERIGVRLKVSRGVAEKDILALRGNE